MARGYKTGGRKPGSKNKRSIDIDAITAKVEASLAEPFDGDAHSLLMLVYKDKTRDIELRLDAAKAAIKFETAALSAIEHSGEVTKTYVARMPAVTPTMDEWRKQHAQSNTTTLQ